MAVRIDRRRSAAPTTYARSLGFPQINIDLIAGMLGETDENWRDCIEKTLALQPDSITIYQMELPFNTTISGDLMKGTGRFAQPVANWATKRRWVREAFEALEASGYHVGSAYTAVKDPSRTRFVYSRSAVAGRRHGRSRRRVVRSHQRRARAEPRHVGDVRRGHPPRRDAAHRAYRPTDEERLIREFILQLKLGSIKPAYFRDKYQRRRPATVSASRSIRSLPTATSERGEQVLRSRATACCERWTAPALLSAAARGIRYT